MKWLTRKLRVRFSFERAITDVTRNILGNDRLLPAALHHGTQLQRTVASFVARDGKIEMRDSLLSRLDDTEVVPSMMQAMKDPLDQALV